MTYDPRPAAPKEGALVWTPEFGRRLGQAIARLGGLKSASRYAGVSDEQVGKWRHGRSKPSFFGIAAIAIAAGVSIDWIIKGDDSESINEITRKILAVDGVINVPSVDISNDKSSVDDELLGLIFDGISKISRDENLRLPPIELGRLSGRVLSDLMSAYADPADRRTALKLALTQLRRELLTPTADTTHSKRIG